MLKFVFSHSTCEASKPRAFSDELGLAIWYLLLARSRSRLIASSLNSDATSINFGRAQDQEFKNRPGDNVLVGEFLCVATVWILWSGSFAYGFIRFFRKLVVFECGSRLVEGTINLLRGTQDMQSDIAEAALYRSESEDR